MSSHFQSELVFSQTFETEIRGLNVFLKTGSHSFSYAPPTNTVQFRLLHSDSM